MRQETLFNTDILYSIYGNFIYYFSFQNMYVYALYILGILMLAWLAVKFVAVNDYQPFYPTAKEVFDTKKASHWLGAAALFLSASAFLVNMLIQENSLFNNFDTMTIDYIDSMKQGTKPVFGEWRFTPVGGIDYNLAYAITNNSIMLSFYMLFKQFLCLYFAYKLFAFMPVGKRLAMLSVINFIPAVFWMNNVIYQEQNIFIFVILSLLALQKYQQNGKPRYLLYFMLAMNLAIYTKETAILLYAGYGAWLVITAVLNEKITFESFLHPLKTIKTLPVEWLMFWSMFVYSTCYMLAEPIEENRYISAHTRSLGEMLDIYKTELVLIVLALAVMIVKIFRRRFKAMDMLGEGSVWGSVLITYVVVFRLRIVPASDYLLSYYLYLPAVFCIAYIVRNVSLKWLLGIFSVILVMWSAWENYIINLSQQGKDRRAVAEFIIARAKNEDMAIYLRINQRIDYKWWKTMAWSSSFKYASPDSHLRFKTDLDIYRFYIREDDKFFETALGKPEKGDYVLVNVFEKPEYVTNSNYETIYQNKTYRLYYIGG
uniref:Glycosyltransferase RgtA/B/C/D-like domain-containing protein n=1 Tax=uncultured Alphaproteobacteria bacterium TaxID=91750 RepID=A0A6G8F365_9PROT|nr:hypothetical protein PlAlph_6570 [uncultured Alphaproteobacteria bacterium]